jgi:hypothetical protein
MYSLSKILTSSEVFIKYRNLSVSNRVLKKSPLSCVVSFLLILEMTTHTSFLLRPLCKGEVLKLFSVERQLISFQNGD